MKVGAAVADDHTSTAHQLQCSLVADSSYQSQSLLNSASNQQQHLPRSTFAQSPYLHPYAAARYAGRQVCPRGRRQCLITLPISQPQSHLPPTTAANPKMHIHIECIPLPHPCAAVHCAARRVCPQHHPQRSSYQYKSRSHSPPTTAAA
jgi:hypothetical protein